MTLPFALPAWLPWWASLVLLVVALLWGLAFLLVPFSVIGVKARLEGIEARLDEVQADIRTLALRLPEEAPTGPFEETYTEPLHGAIGVPPPPAPIRRGPPIPPATSPLSSAPRRPNDSPPPRVPRRVEPRFDPPR